ncbi:MAG: hypothetical protein IPL32_09585 [Chloracidobacterium sp.]|nr:hypothetical protein [Chloracidobacterium sp.]
MTTKILAILLTFFSAVTVFGQAKEAYPADVGSLDSIMKAVYASISGDAGQQRDWDRLRSLFYKGARLIPTGKNPKTGVAGANVFTVEEYIAQAEPYFMKEGFYETEKARRVEMYGHIAHVFSTYESRHAPSEKTPFMRGINSFQLLNDGKRWWVMTIYWKHETPETPIPKKYLKSVK